MNIQKQPEDETKEHIALIIDKNSKLVQIPYYLRVEAHDWIREHRDDVARFNQTVFCVLREKDGNDSIMSLFCVDAKSNLMSQAFMFYNLPHEARKIKGFRDFEERLKELGVELQHR